MTKIMTPSKKTTTAGQLDKAVAIYRALLEKHSGEFDIEAVQTVLGQSEFAGEQFAVFRRCVEMMSNLIIRRVKVDRSRSPQAMVDATGRKQYIDSKVAAAMPHGEGADTEVVFFKLGRYISDNDLDKEYELRGLRPVDPYSLMQANADDLALADEHPNGTHWKNADGKWCCATFHRWDDERYVNVNRFDDDWNDYWWFAGLRK